MAQAAKSAILLKALAGMPALAQAGITVLQRKKAMRAHVSLDKRPCVPYNFMKAFSDGALQDCPFDSRADKARWKDLYSYE